MFPNNASSAEGLCDRGCQEGIIESGASSVLEGGCWGSCRAPASWLLSWQELKNSWNYTHSRIYIYNYRYINIYIYLVYTYRQLHLSEFHWPIRRYHDASPKLCYLWHVAATLPPRQSYFPSSFMPNGTRLWYVAGTESLTSRVRWM